MKDTEKVSDKSCRTWRGTDD